MKAIQAAATRWRDRLLLQEDLNFLLTNRIPRIAVSRWMGRFSRIESPLLARLAIAVWRLFTELDLSDAKHSRFRSLHDCFIRELKPGARPLAPEPAALVSPCDAIVGACGRVEAGRLYQAKGFPYRIEDLFGDAARAAPYRDGSFVTLRLTSAMYHRFHAPADLRIEHVTHIAGDTWNVNPIALKRIERLFCRNERAALHARLADGRPIALVPVAAILVSSLRLHALDLLLHTGYAGPHELPCDASYAKGQEMGWFQHGSTIIVFLPPGLALRVGSGQRLRMGQLLAS
ncbi:archaetidylserine decarboxylase [Paucibacter sp. O1-1]|nr:archaetidylserine decarboxylase [Paucibacter sp. O1-1]MDA3827282.1 archaetidylserine decarboxylase [Paucibacter sp. O1-1]